ncbi:MAG TPA: PAS domain S-box protein, partial [Actinomycetota bacterium]|nr:PAS domain S-box protein [Actinomycetota bacterium]
MTSPARTEHERPPGATGSDPFARSRLPGFVWATDRSLRLHWLSGPADRLRVAPAAAAGRGLFEVVPMGLAEGIAASAHRRAFEGEASNFEFGLAGRTYEARVEPDPGGAVAIAVDVTDRRREEGERVDADAGFRHLVERVPAITYTAEFGASGMWRYVSPQVETILGYTAEEWMADAELFYHRVHPDDQDEYLAAEEQALARGRLRCQYRLLARDGHVVWMRDEAVVVPETAGRPVILQGVMIDVTDQVRAEEALRESELRYRRLVDMSPDAILVHRDGRFVFANPAAARLLGAADPQDLVGLPILEIVHPDFHELVADRARGAHEGRPAPLLEEVFVRADGTPIDVEVAGIPFVFEGRPAGQIVVRDVSERTAADRRIREAERRYRTLVETLPMVTYVVERGEGGRTRYVSPQIEGLVGSTVDECMGNRNVWREMLHPEDRERVLAEDGEADRAERPFSSEYRVVAGDGRVVWVRNEA